MMQAYQLIEEAGFEVADVRNYMNKLRDSNVVNMFGAGEYIEREFGFDRHEQKEVVLQYMDNGLEDTE